MNSSQTRVKTLTDAKQFIGLQFCFGYFLSLDEYYLFDICKWFVMSMNLALFVQDRVCQSVDDHVVIVLTTGPECGSAEFRCLSGQCISSQLRCDLYFDCLDKSDEIDCGKYLFRSSRKWRTTLTNL